MLVSWLGQNRAFTRLQSAGSRPKGVELSERCLTPSHCKESVTFLEVAESRSFGPGWNHRMSPALRKLGLALCFTASLGGFFSNAVSAATAVQMETSVASVQIEKLDETAEGKILESFESCGKLIRLTQGADGVGMHISIHGLGSNPADMAPLSNNAASEGRATSTFAYDDMHCDQADVSQVLASELKQVMAERPGQPLTIESHSLGGRMALAALDNLEKSGDLGTQPVQLELIAPPLAGFNLLNAMMPLPPLVAGIIPGALPSRDMASLSSAQEQIDQVKLPSTVQTKIFYGSEDDLIDYTTDGAHQIAQNLDAQVFYLAGQGHHDMITAKSTWTFSGTSAVPVAYLAGLSPSSQGLH